MTRRIWIPVLAALLVAALIGPGVVVGAEPRTEVTRSVMIPAAAAVPVDETVLYHNYGNYLSIDSGEGSFTLPVSFPVQTVTIRKITLYAYDNVAGASVAASLLRTRPSAGFYTDFMGTVTTNLSPSNPQVVTTTAISPRLVNSANHGLALWVYIEAPGIKFYGVKILYSYEV